MRGRTFALSQKELQRVSVISSCAKGDMACARAAALLALSVRQVKRLKKRLREHGEAALAHANRGQPSPRRLPERVRQTALRLARTTYVGFNDHHLCEKLCEVEGFSLSRRPCVVFCAKPVWALLANAALRLIGSAVCAPLARANWYNWMARPTIGSKAAALASPPSACRMMLPGKSSPLSSFPPNPPP